MTSDNRPYVAAIILDADGKVLVQHHLKTNTLILVSGKQEEGEEPSAALRRELKEETGITDCNLSGCYKFWDKEVGVVCTTYYVEILSGVPENLEPTKHLWQEPKTRSDILKYKLPIAACLEEAMRRNNFIK